MSNEFDIKKWKKFKVGKIFKCNTCPSSIKIELEPGSIPYVTRTSFNNGQDGFVSVEEDKISKGNCITIGAEGIYAFYQEFDFATGVKVYSLRNNYLNRKIGLFICTLLNQEIYKYNYGRARILDKVKNEDIMLPVDDNGLPDWDYMEKFIERLETRERESNGSIGDALRTENKRNLSNLNVSTWKEFYLHKLFNTSMGNGIDAIATTKENPKYNYITRSDINPNGVAGFIDEIDKIIPYPSGTITLALGGSLGACFVQKEPFYTGQNVGILQEKEPLSIHTKLFITTLIRNECKIKFQAFGRELNSHFRKDFTLKLPVLMNGNDYVFDKNKKYSDKGYVPDWKFMENYIKSLPYGDRING